MSDEIAYLRARYVEEEGLAKRAAFGWGADWTADGEGDYAHLSGDGSPRIAESEDVDVLTHAATWDPRRVLVEIAAKRAILDAWESADAEAVMAEKTRPCEGIRAWGQADGLEIAMECLMAPYADRDDFHPEWKEHTPLTPPVPPR